MTPLPVQDVDPGLVDACGESDRSYVCEQVWEWTESESLSRPENQLATYGKLSDEELKERMKRFMEDSHLYVPHDLLEPKPESVPQEVWDRVFKLRQAYLRAGDIQEARAAALAESEYMDSLSEQLQLEVRYR